MSEKNNPPSEYFNGIYYNPSFFQDNTNISLEFGTKNYLSRIGTASSTATSTSFSGVINANNGLNVTGGETVDSLNATTSLSVNGVNINTIYQTISAMSAYQTIANMINYLSKSEATSTYQKIAGMSAYLTSSAAGATYQSLLGMSSYLSKVEASNQYQTLSGMSSYLSSYGASLTYLAKTGAAVVSTALLTTFTGNVAVTGTINDLNIRSYSNGNTSFSTGNTDIYGSSNSRFGYFTGFLSGYSNAVFGDQSLQNCTGNSNTAIGHNSQNSNTSYNYNTTVGSESDISGGSGNIAIGCAAKCSNCSNSIVIGNNMTSTTTNEILLGSSVHTVKLPGSLSGNVINTSGNLSCNGLLSANVLSTSGNLSCSGLLSANVLSTSGNLSCSGLLSANVLSFSNTLNNISATTFSYLSGLTSNIQQQINSSNSNISTLQYKTTDISWTPGQVNKTTIYNQCETTTLSFSNTLNNISTTTFSYLSGLTSNIQQQINAIINLIPPGMVISFAGTSTTLTGYLLCDGSSYNSSQYPYLFNAIGYTYGDAGNGYFKVPNYKGIFLRSTGTQSVQGKIYSSPSLGTTFPDQSISFSTSNYVDNINTQVKTVVSGLTGNIGTYTTTNAISSLTFTTSNNSYNNGNNDTFPAHTSIQYFIKY